MTPHVFKSRVQWFSTVLMGATILFLIYYLYRSFGRAYRFCFGEPERWANHWRVEEAAVIEQSTRATYFGVWVTVILLSTIATLAAIRLLLKHSAVPELALLMRFTLLPGRLSLTVLKRFSPLQT